MTPASWRSRFIAQRATTDDAASTSAAYGRARGRLDTEAFRACRLALLNDARHSIGEDVLAASHYARRLAHTLTTGRPIVGFAEAVAGLRAHGDEPIRLGAVDAPAFHFQLFLDARLTAVVACLGVAVDPDR